MCNNMAAVYSLTFKSFVFKNYKNVYVAHILIENAFLVLAISW